MKRLFVVAMVLSLFACAGKNTSSDVNPADHFLGKDYALLMPKEELKGGLGWRNPEFSPKDFNAFFIEPVTVWNAESLQKESGLKKDDLDILVKYFQDVLTKVPDGTRMKLATAPGPGVIAVRAAVTDVETSSPVSNAMTSVVPVGILISAGKQLATGQAIGVGKCTVEMRFVDSASNKTLAMFADTKFGKKYDSASYTKTGQTEEAMKEWSTLMKERISVLWAN